MCGRWTRTRRRCLNTTGYVDVAFQPTKGHAFQYTKYCFVHQNVMEERRRTRHWLDYSITYMIPMPEGCESRGRSQRCFFLWPDMRRLRSRRQEHSGVDNASVKASQAVLLLSSKLSAGIFFCCVVVTTERTK